MSSAFAVTLKMTGFIQKTSYN